MSSPVLEASAPSVVLAGMRLQMQELLEVLWAARRPAEMLDAVQGLEQLRSTLDAVELRVVREIDAVSAGRSEGWSSTRRFVEAVSGGYQGTGAAAVLLAEAVCGQMARVGEELANATISRPQAEIIVRAVKRLPVRSALRGEAIEVLLASARELPASDLAKAARHLIAILDPEGSDREEERRLEERDRAAYLERFLSITEDGMGGVRIKGRTTVEAAAVIKKALLSLTAPVTTDPGVCGGEGTCTETGCAHDGRDPRDHGTRLVDALTEGCRRLLGTDVLPTSHGSTPRLTLTMDYDQLRAGVGTATLDTGEALHAAAVRRLACDCDVIPMLLGGQGEILDVGRARRLVTLAIWAALVVRDGHCSFPGCNAPPMACDAHHLASWLDGGVTSLDNLCLLCRAHHTTIHNSPWQVRLNPIDKKPEFLPPARIDPHRRPIRRRTPRQE
jgi:hypothetical protein